MTIEEQTSYAEDVYLLVVENLRKAATHNSELDTMLAHLRLKLSVLHFEVKGEHRYHV